MPINVGHIAVGTAIVSVGDATSAGAAGTLTDVGATKGGVSFTPSFENLLITTDQSAGSHRAEPHSQQYELKVPMLESRLGQDRRWFRQPSGNLTGTSPNETLAVDPAQAQYLQVQVVTKGIQGGTGVPATRTITFWRCSVASIGEIKFAKDGEQMREVTLTVHEDTSIPLANGKGRFFLEADTGAS